MKDRPVGAELAGAALTLNRPRSASGIPREADMKRAPDGALEVAAFRRSVLVVLFSPHGVAKGIDDLMQCTNATLD